jgi:hypothetical protein
MVQSKIHLGFDISTTCIGISIFSIEGSLLEVMHLVLKNDKDVLVENRFLAKGNIFKDYIQKFKDYDVQSIFIEEPLQSSSNIFTAALLLKFNGICSYLLYDELKVIPKFISVYDVRKILCPELIKIDNKGKETLSFGKDVDKKEYIYKKIDYKFPNIPWILNRDGNFSKYNYDMSDAIAVGYASLIKADIISI